MQEEVKFFMITILKDDALFANVYNDYNEFLNAFRTFKDKYPVRIWELRDAFGEDFDLVIAKKDARWVACLNPVEPIVDGDPDFVKCVKKEIKITS